SGGAPIGSLTVPDQRMPSHLHSVLRGEVDHLVRGAVAEVALRRLECVELHFVFGGDAVEVLREQSGVVAVLRVDGRPDREVIGVVLSQGRNLAAVVRHTRLAPPATASAGLRAEPPRAPARRHTTRAADTCPGTASSDASRITAESAARPANSGAWPSARSLRRG